MTKRNAPCPCGSGRKFKKCHGSHDAPRLIQPGSPRDQAIQQAYRLKLAEIAQKQKQQGLGRGIISFQDGPRRVVFVGDCIYWSERWRTFHDFLSEFLCQKLGISWCREQQAKPAGERNRIIQWREDVFAEARLSSAIDGVRTGIMTGVQRAYLNLAYNAYLIAHHAPQGQSDKLLATFLSRLRSERSSDFVGKLFETYAAAAFLKAGFTLEYENDSGGRPKHVEFVATYPSAGKKFSVEVKARNHAAIDDADTDDIKRLRIGSKLSQALQKKVSYPLVAMIEINVPDVLTEKDLKGWPTHALEQIHLLEDKNSEGMSELPPAYVLVTNHAFHNNLNIQSVSAQILATGFKIADYGPDVLWGSLSEFLAAQERHKEMFVLLKSLGEHYDIPATFDGENPAYMFAASNNMPRLKFGNWYQIPDEDASFVAGRLYEAVVMEKEQSAFCCYQTEEALIGFRGGEARTGQLGCEPLVREQKRE